MALQIDSLAFSFDRKVVLSGLNLNLESGKLHGLAGLNGAGKTTLLRLIAGHLIPDSGTITWNATRSFADKVSLLETQTWFYPLMSGHDYIDLFSAENRSFPREKWNRIFNLPLAREARSYSAGMQKKLALLAVLALDRELMLLDEPFNTLDLEAVEWLRLLLPGLAAEGRTILLTSHILETLTQTCDTISLLKEGNIEKCFEKENFQELEKMINTIHTSKVKTMLDQLLSDTRK